MNLPYRTFTLAIGLLMWLIYVPSAQACLWDSDTLAMERQRFPEALELITGKFLRHSEAFYHWRIEDRLKQMKAGPEEPLVYDDLAVAYDKVGQHDRAIEVMLEKAERFGWAYETHANLGTFYIHAGQLERGVEEIDKAIAINPDAHFGREIYQKHLVNYILSKQVDGQATLPLSDAKGIFRSRRNSFVTYLRDLHEEGSWEDDARMYAEALKGVAGMMHFGRHDSPILLEAFGDLLAVSYSDGDSKRLAARAYLKASYEVQDPAAAEAYREIASELIKHQMAAPITPGMMNLGDLEALLQGELEEANAWFAQLQANEQQWIASSDDPEAAFDAMYFEPPVQSSSSSYRWLFTWAGVLPLLVGGGLLTLIGVAIWQRVRTGKDKPDELAV